MNKNNYFEIITDSMAPLIEVGDMVFVRSAKKAVFKKNNIVLFQDGSKKILHRVTKIKNNNLFLKGDNAFELQEIKKSEALGLAINIFSGEKTISLGGVRETIFVFLDKVFFQRVLFLHYFKYRVFRYNNMKKIKKLLW
jgi:signal peptidase I